MQFLCIPFLSALVTSVVPFYKWFPKDVFLFVVVVVDIIDIMICLLA